MSTACVSNAVAASLRPELSESNSTQEVQASRAESKSDFRNRPAAKILISIAAGLWQQVQKVLKTQTAKKKLLRVCESVPLGDKRFVAVVQVDHERFLIGGAANSVAMLARLAESASFAGELRKEYPEVGRELQ